MNWIIIFNDLFECPIQIKQSHNRVYVRTCKSKLQTDQSIWNIACVCVDIKRCTQLNYQKRHCRFHFRVFFYVDFVLTWMRIRLCTQFVLFFTTLFVYFTKCHSCIPCLRQLCVAWKIKYIYFTSQVLFSFFYFSAHSLSIFQLLLLLLALMKVYSLAPIEIIHYFSLKKSN